MTPAWRALVGALPKPHSHIFYGTPFAAEFDTMERAFVAASSHHDGALQGAAEFASDHHPAAHRESLRHLYTWATCWFDWALLRTVNPPQPVAKALRCRLRALLQLHAAHAEASTWEAPPTRLFAMKAQIELRVGACLAQWSCWFSDAAARVDELGMDQLADLQEALRAQRALGMDDDALAQQRMFPPQPSSATQERREALVSILGDLSDMVTQLDACKDLPGISRPLYSDKAQANALANRARRMLEALEADLLPAW